MLSAHAVNPLPGPNKFGIFIRIKFNPASRIKNAGGINVRC